MLSRPDVSPDAASHYEAWLYLKRDRAYLALSLGMAGGVQLPQPIPRREIREEGSRRQIEGAELDDFVEIVALVDDEFILVETEKQVAAAKAATSNLKKPTR